MVPKSLHDVVSEVGVYPEEAYLFVREGLNRAVETLHGPLSPELHTVSQYMAEEDIDLAELFERLDDGRVDHSVVEAIEAAGGYQRLNRHVSGQDLCWALRDLAVERWGMLASTVLKRWRINATLDYGRIVFAMIDHGLMQREPHDQLADFEAVYDFDEAMTRTFRVGEDGGEPSVRS